MTKNDLHLVLQGIRDANYHHGGIRCLRLLHLDPDFFADLQADVSRLCAAQHPSNVNDPNHITNWTQPSGQVLQYSLLNATGRYDDFSTDHNLSCFGKRFRDADLYPVLGRLIDVLPHTVNVRINVLGPSAELSPHEEHSVVRTQLGTVSIRPRFHLPIFTNSGAEIILDDHVYHLEEGSIYFFNHGCFHSAHNRSEQTRVHLVWDQLLTLEVFDLMFGEGVDISFPARRVIPSQQNPVPIRQERLGFVRRLPASISEDKALNLTLFEPQ